MGNGVGREGGNGMVKGEGMEGWRRGGRKVGWAGKGRRWARMSCDRNFLGPGYVHESLFFRPPMLFRLPLSRRPTESSVSCYRASSKSFVSLYTYIR